MLGSNAPIEAVMLATGHFFGVRISLWKEICCLNCWTWLFLTFFFGKLSHWWVTTWSSCRATTPNLTLLHCQILTRLYGWFTVSRELSSSPFHRAKPDAPAWFLDKLFMRLWLQTRRNTQWGSECGSVVHVNPLCGVSQVDFCSATTETLPRAEHPDVCKQGLFLRASHRK